MSIARRGLLVLGLLFLGACASVQVSVDYDPHEDFSRFHTFDWMPQPRRVTGDYRVDNPLLDARIRAAVEKQLVAKGYRRLEDRLPDFYVVYHLSVQDKLDVYTVDRGYVDRWGYAISFPETRVQQYEEGTLVLDVADARERKLVWRGVGKGRVRSDSTPEESTRRVNEAVAEILARFPPGAKS